MNDTFHKFIADEEAARLKKIEEEEAKEKEAKEEYEK